MATVIKMAIRTTARTMIQTPIAMNKSLTVTERKPNHSIYYKWGKLIAVYDQLPIKIIFGINS